MCWSVRLAVADGVCGWGCTARWPAWRLTAIAAPASADRPATSPAATGRVLVQELNELAQAGYVTGGLTAAVVVTFVVSAMPTALTVGGLTVMLI
jgi:hypothetical protein